MPTMNRSSYARSRCRLLVWSLCAVVSVVLCGCGHQLRYDALKVSRILVSDLHRARDEPGTYVPEVIEGSEGVELIVNQINRSRFLAGPNAVIGSKPTKAIVLDLIDGKQESFRVLYGNREAVAEGKTWLVSPELFDAVGKAIRLEHLKAGKTGIDLSRLPTVLHRLPPDARHRPHLGHQVVERRGEQGLRAVALGDRRFVVHFDHHAIRTRTHASQGE
jgi:hypothetical protein